MNTKQYFPDGTEYNAPTYFVAGSTFEEHFKNIASGKQAIWLWFYNHPIRSAIYEDCKGNFPRLFDKKRFVRDVNVNLDELSWHKDEFVVNLQIDYDYPEGLECVDLRIPFSLMSRFTYKDFEIWCNNILKERMF